MLQHHHIETIKTTEAIDIIRLNDDIDRVISHTQITDGFVIVSSRHTTTAITINEYESRLMQDLKVWLARLAPPSAKYMHNDIDQRDCPPDEPENAHSHLMAMLLGSSETIPIVNHKLQLGQYQSVLLVELDGPRERSVNILVIGDQKQSWR